MASFTIEYAKDVDAEALETAQQILRCKGEIHSVLDSIDDSRDPISVTAVISREQVEILFKTRRSGGDSFSFAHDTEVLDLPGIISDRTKALAENLVSEEERVLRILGAVSQVLKPLEDACEETHNLEFLGPLEDEVGGTYRMHGAKYVSRKIRFGDTVFRTNRVTPLHGPFKFLGEKSFGLRFEKDGEWNSLKLKLKGSFRGFSPTDLRIEFNTEGYFADITQLGRSYPNLLPEGDELTASAHKVFQCLEQRGTFSP